MYFRIWGAEDRMAATDALIREPITEMGFKEKYATTRAAMDWCRKLRNTYAHCHWDNSIGDGLWYINLQHAAKPNNLRRYKWIGVSETALSEQEQYFKYVQDCLMFLVESTRYLRETRTSRPSHAQWPANKAQPNLRTLPVKYIPLRLGIDPPIPPSAPPPKQKHVLAKVTREAKAERKAKWKRK